MFKALFALLKVLVWLITLPFVLLFRLAAWLVMFTGRLIVGAVGLLLFVVGVGLSFSIVGAVIGIPLALFGILLMIASIW